MNIEIDSDSAEMIARCLGNAGCINALKYWRELIVISRVEVSRGDCKCPICRDGMTGTKDFEAAIPRAKELRANGLSINAIAVVLMDEAYVTKRESPAWNVGMVWRILRGDYD